MHHDSHRQIVLGGQAFNLYCDPRGRLFIGDETIVAFVQRMSLLRRTAVLSDLAAHGLIESPPETAWEANQRGEDDL